jgi:hypothetical protein
MDSVPLPPVSLMSVPTSPSGEDYEILHTRSQAFFKYCCDRATARGLQFASAPPHPQKDIMLPGTIAIRKKGQDLTAFREDLVWY